MIKHESRHNIEIIRNNQLRQNNISGIVVLGEHDYYRRFGFTPDRRLSFAGVPEEYFLALTISGETFGFMSKGQIQ